MNTCEALKNQGNAAFSSGNYPEAITKFTEALKATESLPDEISTSSSSISLPALIYSNRSAAYCAMKDYTLALADAELAVSLHPSWAKGYSRKGAALQGLGKMDEAKMAYEKALSLDPTNPQLQKWAASNSTPNPTNASNSFFDQMNPFLKPGAMERLYQDPSMQAYLRDPSFLAKLESIKRNPSTLSEHLNDPRMLQAVMVAMGINVKTTESNKCNASCSDEACSNTSKTNNTVPTTPSNTTESWSKNEPQESPMAGNWRSDDVRKESDALKEQGNSFYKNRQFEDALACYDKAFEKDSSNISILNNIAAVYFEQGLFMDCISKCQEAVDKGREIFSDFKMIAKSFQRMGTAYMKLDKYPEAIVAFQKSLTEHRTPETLSKLKEAEKAKEIQDKKAYHNSELAEEARQKGNTLFKSGQFADALPHYNEAIKRDENVAAHYSNRAACYTKLMAFPEALRDCDKAIELDPQFVKAYLRKASIYVGMKQHQNCLDVLTIAEEKMNANKNENPTAKEANMKEIIRLQQACYEAMRQSAQAASSMSPEETMKKAMQDPEIASILSDPIMQQILSQMQSNPQALMEHMKNPSVAAKIRKLITAGIIRTA